MEKKETEPFLGWRYEICNLTTVESFVRTLGMKQQFLLCEPKSQSIILYEWSNHFMLGFYEDINGFFWDM
jgi:hypothetical protein